MARQIIQIQSLSDIKVSKNKREYWTLEDTAQVRYLCFIPKLKPFCQIGTEIDAEVEPAKSEGDTPRITMVYNKDNKPVIETQAKEKQRSSWGKSDKELGQQLRIEETKRRSIEAQVSLKSAIDLAIGGLMPIPKEGGSIDLTIVQELIKDTAKEFYLLLQSLTQISEAEVIQRAMKEAYPPIQVISSVTSPSPSKGEEIPQSQEDWGQPLLDKLKKLRWDRNYYQTARSFLKTHYQLDNLEGSIIDCVIRLDEDDRKAFLGEIGI